ncbi:DUF5673 domain-containing protein [Alkaliphilus transvaalensis]|uniref:DUF5673 domain-containing protein n=1 Tax=Alkaliphilus transvaalensis TaxID=114628 RepID=UPI00047A4167|nr:DUF5673 domain-containing protein [Alkaliphilus transvaalensis]
MYNTKRMIIFTVAAILLFLLYPFFQDITYLFVVATFDRVFPPSISVEVYQAFLFILSFLAFAVIQAFTRHFLFYKYRKESNAVMSYPIKSFYIGDRLVYYIVPFFIYLLPIFRQSYLTEIVVLRIGLFIITILFFEGLLRYSKSKTTADFLKDGILVRGIDLRLDFPLTGRIINMSGFYPYEKIDSYLIRESSVELKLSSEFGKIELTFPPEDKSEIKDFIKMMKIPQGTFKK